MSRAAEREAGFTIADDEPEWHVFTDSRRLTRKLLAIAARWGARVQRLDQGYEFTLPLAAVRLVGPPSERQRHASRQTIQKARNALRTPVRHRAPETSLPQGEGGVPSMPAASREEGER